MEKGGKPDLFQTFPEERRQARKEFFIKSGITLTIIMFIMLFPSKNNISGIARVIPQKYVFIEATESGIVNNIYVKDGDVVKKGDVILDLSNNAILSGLGTSYKEEIMLEQELLRLKGEKIWEKRMLERNANLYNKDVIAVSEMELSQLKYKNAQLAMEIKVKELEILRKKREYLKKSLKMAKIRSSIDGVVIGEIENKMGTFVERGDTICQVVDTDRFLLEFPVDEKRIRYASIGQPVTIKFYAYPHKKYKGVLKDIKPIFWEKSERIIVKENVINVYIDFECNNLDLRTGMSAFVRVHTGRTTLIKKIIDKVNYIVSM